MSDTVALKQQINARDIAHIYLGNGKQHSNYDLYYSPFRDDGSNPDFAVYSNRYKDYGSGESGDIIDFLCRHTGCTFKEAIKVLSDHTGTSAIHKPKRVASKPTCTINEPPSIEWQAAARISLEKSQQYLWSDKPDARAALDYLHTQKLTDITIKKHGLGYNPKYYKFTGGDLPRGIVIPIEANGILWRLSVRTGDPKKKYQNATGSKLGGVFNFGAMGPGKPVIIVEGEKDAMVSQQELGERVGVITFGGVSSKGYVTWKDSLQQASQVYILLDNDKAGQVASLHMIATLKTWGIDALPIVLPAGKDATEYVTDYQGDLGAWFEAITQYAWWRNGVPDSWRLAMIKYLTEAFVLIELITTASRAGLIYANAFTFQEVKDAGSQLGYRISTASQSSSLKQLAKKQLIRQLDTNNTDETISKSRINSKRGPKPFYYALRSIQEMSEVILNIGAKRIYEESHPVEPENSILAKMTSKMLTGMDTTENLDGLTEEINTALAPAFDKQEWYKQQAGNRAVRKVKQLEESLNVIESTPLPDKFPKNNISELHRAYAHAIGKKGGERRYSRRELCDLLGVSNSGLHALLIEAGWKKTEQFEIGDELKPDNVAAQIQQQSKKLKGYPKSVIVQNGNTEQTHPLIADAFAEQEHKIRQGAVIRVQYQVSNLYCVEGDEPKIVEEVYSSNKSRGNKGGNSSKKSQIEVIDVLPKPYSGNVYNPVWIACQLKLGLRSLGWQYKLNAETKKWNIANNETGELLPLSASKQTLIETIIGRVLAPIPKTVDIVTEVTDPKELAKVA